MKLYDHKTFGGILLVAGTAIGAGMLALPITTGVSGFYNSIGLILFCFLYMLVALFLLLEVTLHEPNIESNIISMAKRHLGISGQIIGGASFLLLLYAVSAAYMSAGGSLVGELLFHSKVIARHSNTGIYIFTAVFSLIVYFGAWLVDYINRFLMLGLLISYLAVVIFVAPHISITNFSGGNPKFLFAAMPVVLLSFTSHIIVPSLRIYLKNDVKKLTKVFILGSLVPLFFYLIWQLNVLGVVPLEGPDGLMAIATGPHPLAGLTVALHNSLELTWVAGAFGAFSFFALVTSFLGVMLSLIDFFADGLQMKRTKTNLLMLLLLTVIPPLIFAIYFPTGFILALSYAGVFVAILYGILPPLMVWKIRYIDKIKGKFQVPGGKPILIFVLLGAIFVILAQVASTLKLLPTMG